MENILSYLNNFREIKDIVLYFSCEIVLLLGVIFNLSLIPFRKKINLRKTCKIISITALSLNIILLLAICFLKNLNISSYNISFLYEYFEPDERNFFLKIFVNIFMLLFVLINSKHIKKYIYKAPVINSISLLLAMCGCLIVQAGSYILTYLLLEAASILIYKYASNMRTRKYSIYSIDFILLSATATIIFLAFYFLGLSANKSIQMSIINVCLSIAVLMKVGIFPIYNFSIIRSSKTNMPFSLLLFGYMPWIGVIAFNKMSNIILSSDEIYQLSMLAFIIVSLVTFSFYASKHKNIIKFFANFSYFINGLCVLSVIYFQANFDSVRLATMFAFALIAIYSLISILKWNLDLDKIYIANLRGLFLNNRIFSLLFSGILIMMTGLVPNGIMKELLRTLKNIYVYDKTGFLTVCAVSFLMVLILFNALRIVQSIYTFDRKYIRGEFTKRTTLNYVVPIVVIITLLLKTFL